LRTVTFRVFLLSSWVIKTSNYIKL
jgi:hypothetical protein